MAQEGIRNGSKMDKKMDQEHQEGTRNGPKIDPKKTQNEPKMDLKWTKKCIKN